jgi:hypothetical protein
MKFNLGVAPFSGRGDYQLPSFDAKNFSDLKIGLINSWNKSNASKIGAEINLKAEIEFESEDYEIWIGTYEVFEDNKFSLELNGEVQDFCEFAFDIQDDLEDFEQTMNLLFQLDKK